MFVQMYNTWCQRSAIELANKGATKKPADFSISHKIAFVSGTKTILPDRKRPIFDLGFFVFDLAYWKSGPEILSPYLVHILRLNSNYFCSSLKRLVHVD